MNANAKKWVKALKSGKYSQGKNKLHYADKHGKHFFCCMGVACDLAIQNGVKLTSTQYPAPKGQIVFQYKGAGDISREGVLPKIVTRWLGLNSSVGDFVARVGRTTDLTSRNDNRSSFVKIANLIESEPEGLFKK